MFIKRAILLLLLAAFFVKFTHSQHFAWAVNPKGTDYDLCNGLATDDDGNIYGTGYFRSSSLDMLSTTIYNAGGVDGFGTPCFDMYIYKADSNGNVIWARSFGQNSYLESGQSIAFDQSGNCYVTGWFTSTSFQLDSITLSNGGGWDAFIVKFNSSGTAQWAYRIGGSTDDVGMAVTVDPSGNAIVTGYFYSSSITIGTTTLNPSGSCDVFLAKYDPSGNVIWAKKAGGSGQDLGSGLDTDPAGNIYLTGQYSSSNMNFGNHTLGTSGSTDAFLVKYNPGGTDLWAVKGGGSKLDHSNGVSVNAFQGVTITGDFNSSTIAFGTNVLTNALVNMYDVFVVTYDTSGNVLWAKKAGGAADDIGRAVSYNNQGEVFITGDFLSTNLSFGGSTLNNTDSSATFSDIFISGFTFGGAELWMRKVTGLYNENGWAVGTDAHHNVYITGTFESLSVNFGGPSCSNTGVADFFIAKISPDTGSSAINTDAGAYFEIYPNPANNYLFIETNGLNVTEIVLFDLLGRGLKSWPCYSSQEKIHIDLPDLPSGLYLLRVSDGEKRWFEKIRIR